MATSMPATGRDHAARGRRCWSPAGPRPPTRARARPPVPPRRPARSKARTWRAIWAAGLRPVDRGLGLVQLVRVGHALVRLGLLRRCAARRGEFGQRAAAGPRRARSGSRGCRRYPRGDGVTRRAITGPVSRPRSMRMRHTPVSLSPASRARWIGAAPARQQRGRYVPAAETRCLQHRPRQQQPGHDDHEIGRQLAQARLRRGSLSVSGCSPARPAARPASLDRAGGQLARGRQGDRVGVCRHHVHPGWRQAARQGTANSGVPAKPAQRLGHRVGSSWRGWPPRRGNRGDRGRCRAARGTQPAAAARRCFSSFLRAPVRA